MVVVYHDISAKSINNITKHTLCELHKKLFIAQMVFKTFLEIRQTETDKITLPSKLWEGMRLRFQLDISTVLSNVAGFLTGSWLFSHALPGGHLRPYGLSGITHPTTFMVMSTVERGPLPCGKYKITNLH